MNVQLPEPSSARALGNTSSAETMTPTLVWNGQAPIPAQQARPAREAECAPTPAQTSVPQ